MGDGVLKIVVNGDPRIVPEGSTVASLLQGLSLPATRVAVERNREIVRRTEFAEVPLRAGDRIEIVTFVGGG